MNISVVYYLQAACMAQLMMNIYPRGHKQVDMIVVSLTKDRVQF